MKMALPWKQLLLLHVALFPNYDYVALAALSQSDEAQYLTDFASMQAASYAVADRDLPPSMDSCKRSQGPPTNEVTVQASGGTVDSFAVAEQCGSDSVCIIPLGTTLRMDGDLNLGALIVRGAVEWNDDTQAGPIAFLCAGYVAVEGQGRWTMDLQSGDAYVYLKDNGAVHPHLRSRAFGSFAAGGADYPIVDVNGREMARTWSLLSDPLRVGDGRMTLMHDARLMGWRVGDRIAVAPTEKRARGVGEEFTIAGIDDRGALTLDRAARYDHAATFVPPPPHGNAPALMSAEVVNLSRNIVITGDDFQHVPCDPDLPEAVFGEQTSALGCRCSSFRSRCTLGLHTAAMHGGTARIHNVRIERCGQRGVEGKYCLHFHKLSDCPTCSFKNNAIEGSHQRGIIVHSTHSSLVEDNVLYNVRGAGIYVEDGNEMHNEIRTNVVICPHPFSGDLHGCTVPGTSGRIADTSDNQAGIFTRAATNALTGNRVSNSFNGMLLKAGSIGRGESYDKVCESAARISRYEGNTFHGSGRFGTYTLGFNYPKSTDQSILTNGHNIDKQLCTGFDGQGQDTGLASSIVDNVDYNNAFVGHYEAGDIQYHGHHSYDNINLLYWKETKPFANHCSAHLTGGSYAEGNVALPDQATFLIENTSFGPGVSLEANHHCNVGSTGLLCFPTYMLHNVLWKNVDLSMKWVWFQWQQLQAHDANQNHGGIFTLSPPDARRVMDGGAIERSLFPTGGFVSLVSQKFTYLLSLPGEPCVLSEREYGERYDGGILCKVPLRGLKVYSRGQEPGSAPNLKVEIWYNNDGVDSAPDSSQVIGFHQTGSGGPKQGYSLPVIPSADHFYRLSLTTGSGDIPLDWVVEFSDVIVGNRWSIEHINLSLNGRLCGNNGLVTSHHDRSFLWSGIEFMADGAWGNSGACAVNQLPDLPEIDCTSIDDGVLPADECPELCAETCDETTSYCSCGSAECKFKPGFTETSDLCGAARCDHGICSAKYLGGELPVTSRACICDEGWSGPLCQYNPCEALGKTCSGHGTCVATSDTDAACLCDDGFSGVDCEESCDGFCIGDFPFGCSRNSEGIVRYGCHRSGGCSYLQEGEEYPYDGFCTYKQAEEQPCSCGTDNECELSMSCNSDGSCPSPQYASDSTPCNSVPFGTCQSGTCVSDGSSLAPTRNPTNTPPSSPAPSSEAKYCNCSSCTQQVWDALATDASGTYSCGSRISWLQSAQGYSEAVACEKVASEFPDLCACGSASCIETPVPTREPTLKPSVSPTKKAIETSAPTLEPSTSPSNKPTGLPSESPSNRNAYCGCRSCTQQVWDAMATDGDGTYSCGSRISWLQSSQGYGETAACERVASEFPDLCLCGPSSCIGTPSPTARPVETSAPTLEPSTSPSNKPTGLPSTSPSNQFAYCGCRSCTQQVWDAMATDSDGTYSCGSRISWLQSAQGYDETAACEKVASEFPDLCRCGPSSCTGTQSPTTRPTASPSKSTSLRPTTRMRTHTPSRTPSISPSKLPTQLPTSQPSRFPSSRPTTSAPSKNPTPKPTPTQTTSYCGCSACTDPVWNAPVTDGAGTYTCGARIAFLQSLEGGSKSEYDSCKQVSEEFPADECGPACNPSLCNAPQLDDPDPNLLIWSDEFEVDGAPDPLKWTYDLGDGCDIGLCNWGNGEVAYYTKSPNNVIVKDGILSILAKKESGFSLPYTSARMVTRGLQSFKYGRVQFRASLAKCKAVGTWPALWMLPEYRVYGGWPNSGEIDVMEAVGHRADRFYGTVHTTSYNGMIGTQKGNSISKNKDEWHTFEINWEQDRIQFAVDKQIYFEYPRGESIDWPFDQDFHLIMNVAVGGSWGGQEGIDVASFEGAGQVLEVDWVRVYAGTTT